MAVNSSQRQQCHTHACVWHPYGCHMYTCVQTGCLSSVCRACECAEISAFSSARQVCLRLSDGHACQQAVRAVIVHRQTQPRGAQCATTWLPDHSTLPSASRAQQEHSGSRLRGPQLPSPVLHGTGASEPQQSRQGQQAAAGGPTFCLRPLTPICRADACSAAPHSRAQHTASPCALPPGQKKWLQRGPRATRS